MQTRIEMLVRRYFHYLIGGPCEYNFRPDWLKWKTDNNLELDIYYPEFNFAVEVNGPQHKLLKEIRERDKFKLDTCKDRGVFLLVVKHPQFLLRKSTVEFINQQTGMDLWLKSLPYSLKREMKHYRPKKMPFMRAVRWKSTLETYSDLQQAEIEFNRRKLVRMTGF